MLISITKHYGSLDICNIAPGTQLRGTTCDGGCRVLINPNRYITIPNKFYRIIPDKVPYCIIGCAEKRINELTTGNFWTGLSKMTGVEVDRLRRICREYCTGIELPKFIVKHELSLQELHTILRTWKEVCKEHAVISDDSVVEGDLYGFIANKVSADRLDVKRFCLGLLYDEYELEDMAVYFGFSLDKIARIHLAWEEFAGVKDD